MVKKIVGIVLILGGIGGLMEKSIPSILLILAGGYLIKSSKVNKKSNNDVNEIKDDNKIESTSKVKDFNVFKTYIAGITKINNNGEKIQGLIKEYLEDNADSDDYDGMSNKEILEELSFSEEEIYKYELFEKDTIKLVPEPSNRFDKNAVMIVHNYMGHIGYIPAKHAEKVGKIIENGIKNVYIELRGGPFKSVIEDDYGEEKLQTSKTDFYFNVTIEY